SLLCLATQAMLLESLNGFVAVTKTQNTPTFNPQITQSEQDVMWRTWESQEEALAQALDRTGPRKGFRQKGCGQNLTCVFRSCSAQEWDKDVGETE
ncbi:hypothetical protein P7K49_009191, partial [Saguinus oedipus]